MSSYICFIRHGITEGNQKKWFYGSVDIPLVNEGIKELNKLKNKGLYPHEKEAIYYTSGMTRTEQTLKLLYGEVEHAIIPELREMNFGDYECKTYDELKSDDDFNRFAYTNDLEYRFPNGESKIIFANRVYKGLNKLIDNHLNNTVPSIVIAHGGVITASLDRLFPEESKNMWDWMPKPGRGYKIYFKQGKPDRYEVI
ncbi:MAG TPA: histidine phosphatase family protein [Anaerovoracaceae bacterium]|nr:histidine phosphatase family protein [Anaerovoracaceae bacterium]